MEQDPRLRVLVVSGRESADAVWQTRLAGAPVEIRIAAHAASAAGACGAWTPDAAVVDAAEDQVLTLGLVGAALREANPRGVVIAIVDRPSVPRVVALMRAGADDVVEDADAARTGLLPAIRARLKGRERPRGEAAGRRGRRASDRRVWRSRAMRELDALVEAVAASDASILIVGESGAGKEVVANEIHARSARAAGPFVKIDCAAIPRELMEAELFGYRAGAFTGALADRRGLLDEAHGGSVLLDEIAGMPQAAQVKLLRVLQEREFRPIGSAAPVRADFRVICATNVEPVDALRDGRLREDLYYRINTITLRVPPLRERVEDLPLLCEELVEAFGRRHGRPVRAIAPDAWRVLGEHAWPGNVRELENALERAVLVAPGPEITAADLPDSVRHERRAAAGHLPADWTLAELERRAILQALERTGWNKQEAAQALGVYRPTLYSKMRRHGIRSPRRQADDEA